MFHKLVSRKTKASDRRRAREDVLSYGREDFEADFQRADVLNGLGRNFILTSTVAQDEDLYERQPLDALQQKIYGIRTRSRLNYFQDC